MKCAQALQSLTGLTVLALRDTPVDNHMLSHISRLHKLDELDIHKTPVTDAGEATLASISLPQEVFVPVQIVYA